MRLLDSHARRLDDAVATFARGDQSHATALALGELAEAWESAGQKARAAELRALAERVSPGSGGGSRRLPVVGAPTQATREDELVAALLRPEVKGFYHAPSTPPASRVESALRAWAMCRAGDSEAGYLALREHFDAGFESGWGVWSEAVGAADARGASLGCLDHIPCAALVPCALLFGLLGASADAPVGRLRLAPRLPRAWTTFEVTGIQMGDAQIALVYQRSGSEHRFRIRQDGGRVPVMLVFEPEVPEREVEKSLVDGGEAGLSHRSARGRSSVRVQLPLDGEREIKVIGKRIAETP
jgi:hypothetical protein